MLLLLEKAEPNWAAARVLVRRAKGRCRELLEQLLRWARQAERGRRGDEEVAFRNALLELLGQVLAAGGVGEAFYSEVLDLARRFVPGAEAGSILVREGDRFVFKAVWNHPEALFSIAIPVDESWDALDSRPGVLRPPPEKNPALRKWGRVSAIVEVLRVPVVVGDEVVLSLNLDAFRPHAFREDDVRRMRLLAATLGLAFGWLKKAEEVEHYVYHDPLTQLPNERFWNEIGERMLSRLEPGTEVAVLALDVAHLRSVNDSLSHAAGDRLLVELAQRLRKQVFRGDLIARMAGDEFAVLLVRCGREGAERVVRRLRASMEEPVTFLGLALQPRLAIGVAVGRAGRERLATLWNRAALALRRAKARGLPFAFFDPAREEAVQREEQLIVALERGLAEGALSVHLQPIWDLETGRFSDAEALARWVEPPSVFVPLLEQRGLGPRLDRYVVDRALALARRHGVRIWVNLLPSSLGDPGLVGYLEALEAGDRLGLEVTEYALVQSGARRHLERLAQVGYPIALDDFGTGYASLALLVELPLARLKLDRSLVVRLAEPRARALVAGIAALSHDLGLVLVAEGVEDRGLLGELARLGFRYVQGFALARPASYERWPRGLPGPEQD